MKKMICAAVVWLFAASLALAQTNASKASTEAKKAGEAVSAIEKECKKGGDADVAKVKQKLAEAREAAQNAETFAKAAAAEGKDADKAAKYAEEAAKSASEAESAAGGLTVAEKAAQKIDAKKEELKNLAEEDQSLCDGELATAESLLDAVKKKAQELGEKYPCDPEKVRQELDKYLKELRNNRDCEKLREWVEKLFPYDVEQKRYIVTVSLPMPNDVVATVTGTGRTTGHIATVSLYNPTDRPLSFEIPACYIPSSGQYQPYIVPSPTPVTVQPHTTANIPVRGFCADIHTPPVPSGSPMPPVQDWIPAGSLPAGWSPSTANGWKPAPGSSALIPGTDRPLGHTIDLGKNPAAAAPILLDAVARIAAAYDGLKNAGIVTTPFSSNPEREREAVIQQTFWIYAAELTGENYEVEDFSKNTIKQFEASTGQKFNAAPPATRENVEQGVNDFWVSFEAVGVEAKVLASNTQPNAADWGQVVEQKYRLYKTYREMGQNHDEAMRSAIPSSELRRQWSEPFRKRYEGSR